MDLIDGAKAHIQGQGRQITLADPKPWPRPVRALAPVLDELEAFYERHLVLPKGASAAMALYAATTYVVSHLEIAPYLGVTSPLERSGKTLVQEAMMVSVLRPLIAGNVTPAAIFRIMDEFAPTLLIDEYDTARRDEALRAVLNAGHRRTTSNIYRCSERDFKPEPYDVFGCKILGLIGSLPRTVEDRSIVINVLRKKRDESGQRICSPSSAIESSYWF